MATSFFLMYKKVYACCSSFLYASWNVMRPAAKGRRSRFTLPAKKILILSLGFCVAWTSFAATDPAIAEAANNPKQIEVVATGYTAGVESTGKRPGQAGYGITYSGVKVRRDQVSTIAADPKLFPIGTLLYIPGYGYGVVADTGSAIKGNRIDLYFETIKEVYEQWGKRKVSVQVLRRGTGKLTESWLDNINQVVQVGKPIPQSYLES